MAIDSDRRLAQLGAVRVLPLGQGDDNEAIEEVRATVLRRLLHASALRCA